MTEARVKTSQLDFREVGTLFEEESRVAPFSRDGNAFVRADDFMGQVMKLHAKFVRIGESKSLRSVHSEGQPTLTLFIVTRQPTLRRGPWSRAFGFLFNSGRSDISQISGSNRRYMY